MDPLVKVFADYGPQWMGWGIAVFVIGMYFRATARSIEISERSTETAKERAVTEQLRSTQYAEIVAALKHLATVIEERLPRRK